MSSTAFCSLSPSLHLGVNCVCVFYCFPVKSERIDINMYIDIGGILIRKLNEMSISESKSHNHSYWKPIHQVDGVLEGAHFGPPFEGIYPFSELCFDPHLLQSQGHRVSNGWNSQNMKSPLF